MWLDGEDTQAGRRIHQLVAQALTAEAAGEAFDDRTLVRAAGQVRLHRGDVMVEREPSRARTPEEALGLRAGRVQRELERHGTAEPVPGVGHQHPLRVVAGDVRPLHTPDGAG